MKRKTLLLTLSTAALALIAPSCAPATPQTRISKNPELYNKLPASQKTLAEQGQIKRGMSKDAVFIAWGNPAQRITGSKNGKLYEKWIYTHSTPVYSTGFGPRIGYGGWGSGGWRGGYYGIGVSPRVHYVQRPSGFVNFNQYGKVTDWSVRH